MSIWDRVVYFFGWHRKKDPPLVKAQQPVIPAEKHVAKEPVVKTPVVKEHFVERNFKESVIKIPVVSEPFVEKPVVKKTVEEKQTVKKPVAAKPTPVIVTSPILENTSSQEHTELSLIEGISKDDAKKLINAGATSVERYLQLCKTKHDRHEFAKKSGIEESLILKWANYADLIRIDGIGGKYARLLEAGGVDTVPELSNRNAKNLYQKLAEVNKGETFTKRLPTEEMIKDWIDEAKKIPRILFY